MAGREYHVRRTRTRARAATDGSITAPATEKVDGRRARGERSRAAVLECAIARASTDGLESLTLGQVAADAGVGKSNLTVLFGDRLALQLATLEAAIATIVSDIIEPALEKDDSRARLRALCDGWFAYVRRQTFPGGCFMYATAHEYRARPGAIRERILRELNNWNRLFGATIKRGIADGSFRADVNVRDAVGFLVAFQNSGHLALLLDDKAGFDAAARLTRTFLASLDA